MDRPFKASSGPEQAIRNVRQSNAWPRKRFIAGINNKYGDTDVSHAVDAYPDSGELID